MVTGISHDKKLPCHYLPIHRLPWQSGHSLDYQHVHTMTPSVC